MPKRFDPQFLLSQSEEQLRRLAATGMPGRPKGSSNRPQYANLNVPRIGSVERTKVDRANQLATKISFGLKRREREIINSWHDTKRR